jgi:hypothetical protein
MGHGRSDSASKRTELALVLQLHFLARLIVDFSSNFIVADAPIDPLKQK